MIDGPNIKKGKSKYELALKIKEDIANFRKTSRVSRMVTCWCGSNDSVEPHQQVTMRDTREVLRKFAMSSLIFSASSYLLLPFLMLGPSIIFTKSWSNAA